MQYVSSTPATRLDVINLQESLDHRLLQRQARETGIDPVREELYGQCFDELIRQVTINCAERGLLLLRVRDEIRMTIAAYQTLYESSIAFGMCAHQTHQCPSHWPPWLLWGWACPFTRSAHSTRTTCFLVSVCWLKHD